MKLRKILYVVSGALLIVGASACTDLTEKVYDLISATLLSSHDTTVFLRFS